MASPRTRSQKAKAQLCERGSEEAEVELPEFVPEITSQGKEGRRKCK